MPKRTLYALAAATVAAAAWIASDLRARGRTALEEDLTQLAWRQEGITLDATNLKHLRRRGFYTTVAVDPSGEGTTLALLRFQRDANGHARLTVDAVG